MTERRAVLMLTSYAGHHEEPCIVVGETPKRFRIRADKRIRLGGGFRWLEPGVTALVPKHAIRFEGGTQ